MGGQDGGRAPQLGRLLDLATDAEHDGGVLDRGDGLLHALQLVTLLQRLRKEGTRLDIFPSVGRNQTEQSHDHGSLEPVAELLPQLHALPAETGGLDQITTVESQLAQTGKTESDTPAIAQAAPKYQAFLEEGLGFAEIGASHGRVSEVEKTGCRAPIVADLTT